ncbi:MAG: DUF1152 domain-containing protein [Chloroflexi bacterium]|nr:DUF1152 domain-containing protein [Chloroflexota bacterium]
MQLNLPILDRLNGCKSILIAGAGGGFDVFVGLPIYFTLRRLGYNVHLANYSFCDFMLASMFSEPIALSPLVLGARPPQDKPLPYYAEGYLARWFQETQQEDVTIWMFAKTGAGPLMEGYATLTEHLSTDALILVDGGVDSIMRGDEAGPGTLLEDSISLTAANTLNIPVKLLACLGFGTEIEEEVCHHHALENIAALAKAGGFLGNCSLTPQMDVFQKFEAACRYVWEQPRHPKSHITTRVIPAVHGEFGNHYMYPDDDTLNRIPIFVSPLMSLYWWFNAETVIQHNLLIPLLSDTETTIDAFRAYAALRPHLTIRPRKNIPY